ncbi:hypothetical protein D3C73_1075700 [compost metagenome]
MGEHRALAPGTTTIMLSVGVNNTVATPVAASFIIFTLSTSTWLCFKESSSVLPNASFPTAPTMIVCAPNRAAATA